MCRRNRVCVCVCVCVCVLLECHDQLNHRECAGLFPLFLYIYIHTFIHIFIIVLKEKAREGGNPTLPALETIDTVDSASRSSRHTHTQVYAAITL